MNLSSALTENLSATVALDHGVVSGPLGVSVVLCCHNSEMLLPETLAHLKAQKVDAAMQWELLLVDNASSDSTVAVARQCWGNNGPVPMRIVHESRLGLSHARERAFKDASYDIIGFIDDDNWVCDNWVEAVAEIFVREPDLAAVGSLVYPVFEGKPPAWWHEYGADYFALMAKPVQDPLFLNGAGLAIRKAAWRVLCERGFRSGLIGRKGKSLSGGEDTELTTALRLGGWRLVVSSRLTIQHFMPSQRLRWNYLRRLVRGYTASHVLLDAYSDYSISLGAARHLVSDAWCYQLARTMVKLASRPRFVIAALASTGEGRSDVVEVDKLLGRAIGLLRSRGRYGRSRRAVRVAHWRQPANEVAENGVRRR